MHILPHISLFLLALVLSCSFMLSWCSLLNVSNDHCNCHNTLLEPSVHSGVHFQFIRLHTVSLMNPMYCTVSCCTMWLSFATLPVIVWKRSRAAYFYISLSIYISLSLYFLSGSDFSSAVSLLLPRLSLSPSLQFFVLFFVFLHHFIPLESPRHASDLLVQFSRCISP